MESPIWHYPRIWALGTPVLVDLEISPSLQVEEKVDGSQLSAMIDRELRLHVKSKSAIVFAENPGMFKEAVQTLEKIKGAMIPEWVYRFEYLAKPKHNTLVYDRIPKQHLVLLDVEMTKHNFAEVSTRNYIATKVLGLEPVPVLWSGPITLAEINDLLTRKSFLGNALIEGVVLKAYSRFVVETGHVMMGKFVSEAFKEKHSTEWKKANPGRNDVLENITEMYRTEARWNKAIQHLEERGELEHSPRDIGKLLKEVGIDILSECEDEIKELLWKWSWPKIQRGITRGFAEHYKKVLMERQFEGSIT